MKYTLLLFTLIFSANTYSAQYNSEEEITKAGEKIEESLNTLAKLNDDQKLRVIMDIAGGVGNKWREFSLPAIKSNEVTLKESRLMYSFILIRLASSAEIAGYPTAAACYAIESDFMYQLSAGKTTPEASPSCRLNAYPPGSQSKVIIMMKQQHETSEGKRLNILAGKLIKNIMLESFYTMKIMR